MTLQVYAPATVANLAAGFDTLGIALKDMQPTKLFGDVVHIQQGSQPYTLTVRGCYAAQCPLEQNILHYTWQLFSREIIARGEKPRPMNVILYKNLPLSSGLGSSASSIVASLVAYNYFHNEILTQHELLWLAGQAEGHISGSIHYDNVAPSLYGGLLLLNFKEGQKIPQCERLPFDINRWSLVILQLEHSINTKEARSLLPHTYPRNTVINQMQNLAKFILALYENRDDLLKDALRDNLAEPYRKSLLLGFERIQDAAYKAGALGCSFSGSGPAMFAWTPLALAEGVGEAMHTAAQQCGYKSTLRICQPDTLGTRKLPASLWLYE